MPQTRHIERHFTANDTIRDIIIGMSDGLTVPFALAAGVSTAAASSVIIVTAGLAEIAAGSISMGLGGYLAARNDAEHYDTERLREVSEVSQMPDAEKREVHDILVSYGLNDTQSGAIVDALAAQPEQWVDFMMRFELGMEKPEIKACPFECLNHRHFVCRWWLYPAAALHTDRRHSDSPNRVGGGDPDSTFCLWLC